MSLRENAEETYELLLQTQLDLAAVQKKIADPGRGLRSRQLQSARSLRFMTRHVGTWLRATQRRA